MKKSLILVIAVFYTAITVNATELNVYPVPAVFASKNIENSTFSKVLFNNRQNFTNKFLFLFDKYFPNVNKELSDKTKYKTFAAYVNVPRASEYQVKKTDKLLDIYLPLTMSINFVNMASGETLYSLPITNYNKYETTTLVASNVQKNTINELNIKNYEDTLEEIIKSASEKFKPFDITTKINDTYRKFYILDKGSESGIAKGDLLTDADVNQLSVIYSDLNYSVAEKVLGKPSINSEFSKFANSNITQLKKPKILFINDFDNEKLYNLFTSSIGNNAEFSLVTTDKTFYDMQEALVSLNINFKNRNVYNRKTPDYFLKLYFTKPAYAQYKSNKDYYNVDKYGIVACGVIFDKAGRVVYSECVDDEMINNVIGDVRFNNEANTEIVTKNILLKLAESMQKNIQFKNIKFKIAKVDNQFIKIADPNGYLKVGNILTVFKKINTEKSGQEIIIPTWDYRVISSNDGIAECKMSQPYIDDINYPSKRDVIQMTTMTRSANKANMISYYPDKIEIDGNEIHLYNFEKIAFSALASSLKAPLAMSDTDFQEQIDELNSLGFRDRIEISHNTGNITIKVVYKINKIEEKTVGNSLKQQYKIIIGIVTKKNNETIKQDGIMQNVTIIVPKENNQNIIEYELLKYIYPLIKKVASKF